MSGRSVMMNHRDDSAGQDDLPRMSEAAVRKMLEESRRDIAEGRVVPLAPVLDRLRAAAERVRRERSATAGTDSSHA
jgi:hypothetical protein